MFIDFLVGIFEEKQEQDAVVWQDKIYSYRQIIEYIRQYREKLCRDVSPGTIVIMDADFSPQAIALLLALIEHATIVVPLSRASRALKNEFIKIAQGEILFEITCNDEVAIQKLPNTADHPLYKKLREKGHPGLVLFSSGSTGKNKASVHDMTALLEKFKVRKRTFRTITFLQYDHIGGINTLFYTLSNGGCLITVSERSPDGVLQTVEKFRAELLPVSPTFLNLVLLSEAYLRHDIRSLQTITYGTEPMPESTLKRFHELFPHIRLQQTYGLSEVGILRSQSRSSDSLWVKIGGEGFQTRVVDGILQIKASSAMLGYLNAPSPFTEDGWFDTGDSVEVDGEYLKILGRNSEIINVGGEKVYPAEVESVIREVDGVEDVTVYGEKNSITGQIVCAKVLSSILDRKKLTLRIKKHCREKLQNYKVPVKIVFSDERQYGERFKKVRPL